MPSFTTHPGNPRMKLLIIDGRIALWLLDGHSVGIARWGRA
jgi:hypothetical protein